jgi:caffeoyl-CoA O-methyltransferase
MITEKKFEEYVEKHTTAETSLMLEINRQTHLKTFYPNMLSGQIQGKFLEMVSRMIRPRRILEIGTFTGYSAIAFAAGLADDGKIITIDINDELRELVNDFVERSGYSDKIEIRIGDALQIIPTLDMEFDLVFIDADKEQYVDYYEMAMPKLKKGGFILADNVLWGGKVLEPDARSDKETLGIKAFNEHLRNDTRVEQVMLTIRDGLMLARKL